MKEINAKMIGLEAVTGLPVEEGDYGGDAKEYIVYDYADQRGGLFGDDRAVTIESEMQIRVVLKKQTEYDDIKDNIWEYLEDQDFDDISFESYCQRETDGMYRYLIFDCSYTEQRGE